MYVKIDYLVHGLGQVGNVDYGLTYLYDGTPKNMLFLPTLVPLKAVDEQLCSSLVEVFAQAAGAALVEGSVVYALSRPDAETCLWCSVLFRVLTSVALSSGVRLIGGAAMLGPTIILISPSS